jgi:polysaccharide pyruvyl transferase WcaK-like protein
MKKKKIGFFGTRGNITNSALFSNARLLSEIGQNSGNLLFQYSLFNLIKNDKLIVGKDVSWDPSSVASSCEILVVPSANFIRENFDFTEMISYIKKTKLPVLFVGLGVQAENYEDRKFNFHSSIVEMIALIKDQSTGVSVRGNFTAKILSDLGVDKIKITGCPSNFINSDPRMREFLEKKWDEKKIRLVANADEPWPKSLVKKNAERKLFNYCYNHAGIYVQQSVEPFIRAVRAGNFYSEGDVSPELMVSLKNALAPDVELDKFTDFFYHTVRFYISIDQWMEDIGRFNLSVGLRLHGNMVSLQSGCPAIWIRHDSRTSELVETMGLPSLSLDQFNDSSSLDECKDMTNFDMDIYFKKRIELKKELNELLTFNGIEMS